MFDLDQHIHQWKQDLEQEGRFMVDDLEELEGHLREEIRGLTAKGLTDEEAFGVACLRLGSKKNLAEEYAKVNAGLVFGYRLFWVSAGFFGFVLSNVLAKGA